MAKRAVKAAKNIEAGLPVPAGNLQASPDRVADHLNNRIFFRLFQVGNTLQRQAVKELGVPVPIVIRMEGTNVEEGKRMLRDSGLNFTTADSMGEGADKVVALASPAVRA